MRPRILFDLFAPVTILPGVGPRVGRLLEKAAGPRIVDLLWHLPTDIVDRSYRPSVAEAQPGRIATLALTVDGHQPPRTPRQPYRVRCRDATGFIQLVFFHAQPDYLLRVLPVGERRIVSGKIETFRDEPQITHPDYIADPENSGDAPLVEPVYRLTAGLTLRAMGRYVAEAVRRAPELPEWIEPQWLQRQAWPSWREAVEKAHTPEGASDLSPESPARQRLAYDELLASQLALHLMRRRIRHQCGRPQAGDGRLRTAAEAALPYALTPSQQSAIGEVLADMAAPKRMVRLLQGDVGSGKTVVALMAMLNAVECGAQAALMAPTEILARQHFATLAPLADAVGISTTLLTGRDRGRVRDSALSEIADGRARLVVGTHALFQEDVEFDNLGLAVIDEQHRFGVHQRMMLTRKGADADMLVMTATPIPRTLILAAYGDMDVSRITGKPPGRREIDTRALPLRRIDEVVTAVRRAVEGGSKVYWVCPLVDESETSDLAAATARHQALQRVFGGRAGLVHGRMKGTEKDAIMAAFAHGGVDVLVATTVIEVGVDVPAATVMVIEHAERFGLAQLHQLRGRIGRGDQESTCLLLYGDGLGETAKKRIEVMRRTNDGFEIAEEDLRLRGAGEVLGTRQSGLPDLKLADLAAHQDLLAVARDDARLCLERNPRLADARGEALRVLLYLFERDVAVRYLASG